MNKFEKALDILSMVMPILSIGALAIVALKDILSPLTLFILLFSMGSVLIIIFSKDSRSLKVKLFLFFFSSYLFYIVMHDYILISLSPNELPFDYLDDATFYHYSNFALPYIFGEKNFFDMFDMYKAYEIHELPLHVIFSSLITYFSTMIDGNNTILTQRLLSPFFGGMFSVFLYATLKYQFKDRAFALKATIIYGLLSAVFMYSTPLMRDIDVALAYMVFIYLFLQKNSMKNFILLLLVSFLTLYLRVESGMVLFALTLLYAYLYVGKLESRSLKLIFFILVMGMISFIVVLMSHKIIGMIVGLNEANTERAIAQSSAGSISLLFNKFPFPLSYIAKVLFGQMQPFPFVLAIDRPPEAISGIFWPFIFIMMLYAVMKKNMRILLDEKVKYMLIVAIAVLFLMSSEPMTRRMMSVYPIIYIASLYTFLSIPKDKIKKIFSYYIFGIISLNVFYYFIKL